MGLYLQNPALLWDMEVRGYNQELAYARNIGDIAVEKHILALMERRRLEIFGEP